MPRGGSLSQKSLMGGDGSGMEGISGSSEGADVVVSYRCAVCQRAGWSLAELYYCKNDKRLTCARCTIAEVDGTACPHCLTVYPSNEAMLYRHACSKCWRCPSCSVTLSVIKASEADSSELYAFQCSFCRWSSRSIPGYSAGSPSELLTSALSLERLAPSATAFSQTVANTRSRAATGFRAAAAKPENAVSGGGAGGGMKSGLGTTPRTPLKPSSVSGGGNAVGASVSAGAGAGAQGGVGGGGGGKARLGAASSSWLQAEKSAEKRAAAMAAAARGGAPPEGMTLPEAGGDGGLTAPPEVKSGQKRETPERVPLISRRARRCRTCERFVAKPERAPESASWKVASMGTSYAPRVAVVAPPPAVRGDGTGQRLVISLVNPVEAVVRLEVEAGDGGSLELTEGSFGYKTWIGPADELAELDGSADLDEALAEAVEAAAKELPDEDRPGVVERSGNRLVLSATVKAGEKTAVGDVGVAALMLTASFTDDVGVDHRIAVKVDVGLGVVRRKSSSNTQGG